MRKINENNYLDYTIAGDHWSLTISTFINALREWNNITLTGCTFYGNKHNGTRAIIDTK